MKPVILPAELHDLRRKEDLIFVDASSGADAYQKYSASHVKGAVYVDLDKDLSQKPEDASKGGRHPLPDIKDFTSLLGKIGIEKSSHVIVYDDKSGAFSAARFWWMLKSLG